MKGILDVTKHDKGAQVEILNNQSTAKMSKLDRKILAQHRKQQRILKSKATNGPLRRSSTMLLRDDEIEDLLPNFENTNKSDALDSMLNS